MVWPGAAPALGFEGNPIKGLRGVPSPRGAEAAERTPRGSQAAPGWALPQAQPGSNFIKGPRAPATPQQTQISRVPRHPRYLWGREAEISGGPNPDAG